MGVLPIFANPIGRVEALGGDRLVAEAGAVDEGCAAFLVADIRVGIGEGENDSRGIAFGGGFQARFLGFTGEGLAE